MGNNHTKKILHYLFNCQNRYENKGEELQMQGVHEIYKKAGPETILKAKKYLAHLVVKQISVESVEGYLDGSRIKDQKSFTSYILKFRKDLKRGLVRMRVSSKKHQ